ncbi:AAA domain-containing protein [Alistipes shahii]|uniref:AAA domain-containing protein n=1 Tax=Alistipes shahii TaxID=328814 RepID=UPI003F7C7FB6
MYSPRENRIIIDGEDKTDSVERCWYTSRPNRCHVIFCHYPKTYSYVPSKVLWLKDPVVFDPQHCHLLHKGRRIEPLSYIAAFQQGARRFWYVEYANGTGAHYKGSEVELVRSCLEEPPAQDRFAYLRDVAELNPLKTDDGQKLLLMQYQKIDFVSDRSAAALYLNPGKDSPRQFPAAPLIYPFGCNASQQRAIQAAFGNQISIIQGPPGTGKTQTILNIVANLVVQEKTVLVVSNNNSAIENVVEKLEKKGLGFLTALLGSRERKTAFVETQAIEKAIPAEIDSWYSAETDSPEFLRTIQSEAESLQTVFERQERLARARQELTGLQTEQFHFEQETTIDSSVTLRRQMPSARLLMLWNELQAVVEWQPNRLFDRWREAVRWFLLKRRIRRLFDGFPRRPERQDLQRLIPLLQRSYYQVRQEELTAEIDRIEKQLATSDAPAMVARLSDDSTHYLRSRLAGRFGKGHKRPIFQHITPPELLKEYPVVLSTTFSSRSNFRAETLFDYVIMDEASQVSSETGALALMCARNAVIVGDSMQLPNVITDADRLRMQAIGAKHVIDPRYDCAALSFLESVCRVFPEAPQTLLREHYRCHPKIINFCNQRFYGGRLLIMTEDRGEPDVITAWRTAPGYHARGAFNPREIETIRREVLPSLPCEQAKIGIISPYNEQVNALHRELGGGIDVATVHKFQGREKEAIILSTVDNQITVFTDDPNLLNVAVSRAKRQFTLVTSSNEQPDSRNIADLLAYIDYNGGKITESAIHSVFDLLYEPYAEARREFLKRHRRISEFDSENLTYALLERVLETDPAFRHLGVLCHQPLRQLIRDWTLLNDEERRYASNGATHLDFLIYNRVGKRPILAIETDGYQFHKQGTRQSERDRMKDRILDRYGLPLLRLSTTGTDEEAKIHTQLTELLQR